MTNQISLLLAGFTFFPTVNILKETKVYLNKDLEFQMFWCHSWRLKMFPVLILNQHILKRYNTITVKPVLTTSFLKQPPVLNDHVVVLL